MRLCKGGSQVGIFKCLVSAFCQGFTLLSEIERHTFVLVVILIKWQTALCAIFPHLPVVMMAVFSSIWDFWPSFPFLTSFLTFLFTRPFHLGPWYTFVFFVILVLLLMLSSITKEYHWSKDDKDWRNRSQIDTRRKAQAQMISNSSDVSFVPRTSQGHCLFVYDTLTALGTQDIWHIFCFSCPFMSFEAPRKSQYAKLVQITSIVCR